MRGCKATDGNIDAFRCLKVNSLRLYLAAALRGQTNLTLELFEAMTSHIYKQLCQTWWWWRRRRTVACCLSALRQGPGTLWLLAHAAACLSPPGTAGLPIFRMPLASLSKINGAEGRWIEEQRVQAPWLSPGTPFCWHSINYLEKKKNERATSAYSTQSHLSSRVVLFCRRVCPQVCGLKASAADQGQDCCLDLGANVITLTF